MLHENIAEMVCSLSEADSHALLLLNNMHTPALDQIMFAVSDKWIWAPFYALLALLMFRQCTWRRAALALLLTALTVAATDQSCATLIRPAIGRLRPTSPDNPISALVHTVNGYRGGRYGFPSCHAANTFALATFLSLYFRRRVATASLFAWAITVSYSRIYLGVHYPGDVLCGMAIGTLYAMSAHFLIFAPIARKTPRVCIRHRTKPAAPLTPARPRFAEPLPRNGVSI